MICSSSSVVHLIHGSTCPALIEASGNMPMSMIERTTGMALPADSTRRQRTGGFFDERTRLEAMNTRYQPSSSSSRSQSLSPCAVTISSIDRRKSRWGSSDSTASATLPSNGGSLALASSSIELAPPGSKKSRSDRTPRTTVSSEPPPESSDTVEKLSCSSDEREKHDSLESKYTELTVL
ncbi:hypothetical protein C4D60_Mb06t08140 [Musa balbisiana]|uniref:Uncharacterized protein n=1 Tax=Musa balbisiana TaxID=52838 RepID=A0A4S8IMU1_MUSBA|nr:hypothetical protein C4D60_Mb06t08140 [Musa balbisiana]